MLKVLVDVVFPQSVFDVVGFLFVFPILVKLVDFTRNVTLLFQVKTLRQQEKKRDIIAFSNEIISLICNSPCELRKILLCLEA